MDHLSKIQSETTCKSRKMISIQILPIEFDKDDESNYHIEFTVVASNLKADYSGNSTVDRNKNRLITRKIIPVKAILSGLVV